ncbi:zona pellucida-like domain-containing protein 1 [Gastrophryne carolinensis]
MDNITVRSTMITRDLKWAMHTNLVVKKAQERLDFLRELRKYGLSKKVLTMFYRKTILLNCKFNSFALRRLNQILLYNMLCYLIHEYQCFDISSCAGTFREPDVNDILVTCGPQQIELSVLLCPIYYAGYNETQLYMNEIFSNSACQGGIDLSGTVPVLKFVFSINDSSICGSSFLVSDTAPGIFEGFSKIQYVNISGIIKSKDQTVGVITRSPELKYLYSCNYPLEYLLNNTRLDVAGNHIAIDTKNGSFISTLSVQLFVDANYRRPLTIPSTGIKLNSTVFVEVRASNLTEKFNVLLDRCYASISPYPTNSTYYDLFAGCTRDKYTFITANGVSQAARFYFSAFRFLEQYQQTISTFYLHCITRLCETSACSGFIETCARRRRNVREVSSSSGTTTISAPATVTSPGIVTNSENGKPCATKELTEEFLPENCAHINNPGTPRILEVCTSREYIVCGSIMTAMSYPEEPLPTGCVGSDSKSPADAATYYSGSSEADSQEIVNTAVGLGITVGFLALLCTLMGGLAYLMHKRLQKSRYQEKSFH